MLKFGRFRANALKYIGTCLDLRKCMHTFFRQVRANFNRSWNCLLFTVRSPSSARFSVRVPRGTCEEHGLVCCCARNFCAGLRLSAELLATREVGPPLLTPP